MIAALGDHGLCAGCLGRCTVHGWGDRPHYLVGGRTDPEGGSADARFCRFLGVILTQIKR